MCSGISIARCEIPESLIDRYQLSNQIIRRSEKADEEFRFLLAERFPVLPVWYDGQFQVLAWGKPDRHTGLRSQAGVRARRWNRESGPPCNPAKSSSRPRSVGTEASGIKFAKGSKA